MMTFDYNPSIRVIFAAGALERIGELAAELKSRRALLVSDPGVVAAGHAEKAVKRLQKAEIEVTIFDSVAENPTTREVDKGVALARDFQPDLLIGLGGGSAMDCAKGINFLFTNDGKMADYWGVGKASRPMLPSIGIPTTAGTGSEAQSFALISDALTHRKMACGDVKARFRAVILDPELVVSAPEQVRASTGMDAISHAVESYVCTKANVVSRMFAAEAWRLLSGNFETAISASASVEQLGSMLVGAHLAGSAIEHSMLGAAHACANPLTAKYGITHGMAVGLMLPHVIRFNAETANAGYRALLSSVGEAINGRGAGEQLARQVEAWMDKAGWPMNLCDLQVPEDELYELANGAFGQWTRQFNPRATGESDLLNLYQQAYSGN